MQNSQRWIVGLLIVIALLLAAMIILDFTDRGGEAPAGNEVIAENATAPVENGAVPVPVLGGDPIDAAVDNILAADADAPVEVKVASIPRPFWGLWSQRSELCGQPEADDSALEIGARKLIFWESSGEVRSVVLKSPLSVEIAAGFTGEGENWDATGTYTLSPSKQELIVASAEGRATRYKRCG